MRDALSLADDLAEFADQLVAAIQARTIGQLRIDDQVALVLFRDEPGGCGPEAQKGEEHQSAIDHQPDDARSQQQADDGSHNP